MPAEAMPPLVKICGISEPQHARAAASLGADFIGIVFAPSRRQVTMGQAVKIADALGKDRGSTPSPLAATPGQIEERLRLQRPLLVGVFADQDVDTINTIAEQCSLDLVQLNGSEPWDICRLIQRPVLKAVKLPESATLEEALDRMGDGAIPLLDASVEGLYGGTGQRLDWGLAAALAARFTLVLAGGLEPANVQEAIETVKPWAVDVSSGIETGGRKDVEKMRAFIKIAKESRLPQSL